MAKVRTPVPPAKRPREPLTGTMQLRLPASQLDWLDKVSDKHSVPRSHLLRFAISLLIQTYGRNTDDLVEDVAVELYDLRRTRGPVRRGRRGS